MEFMSLGSNCLSLAILGYGMNGRGCLVENDERVKGPVDNVWSYGIQTAIDLITGDFKKQILQGPIEISARQPGWPGDSDKEYKYNSFSIVHNDATSEKFHKSIMERIKNFEVFYKKAKHNSSKMFIYTIGKFDTDNGIPKKSFIDGVNKLKRIIDIKKVIFVGNRKSFNKTTPFEWYLKDNFVKDLGITYVELKDAGIRYEQDIKNANALFKQLLRNDTKKTISVIIPTYNSADFIQPTLDNVIASLSIQDKLNWEILLVDDYSSDNTVDVCNKYASNKIRVIKSYKNCGAGAARNTGAHYATGDFITFLDSDDLINIQYFSEVADAIYLHPEKDIYYTNFLPRDKGEVSEAAYNKERFITKNFIPLGVTRVIFKSEIIKANNVSFIKANAFEGETFCIQYFNNCTNKEVLFIINAYYKAIRRSNSITSQDIKKLHETVKSSKPELLALRKKAIAENYSEESISIIDGFIEKSNKY